MHRHLLPWLTGRARRLDARLALGARRNAMVATTAALARRHEREEVEAYLATRAARRRPAAGTAPVAVGGPVPRGAAVADVTSRGAASG